MEYKSSFLADEKEFNEVFNNIKELVINSRNKVYTTVNTEMLNLYWNIGRIIMEIQQGDERASYGDAVLEKLSLKLTNEFGKGFSARNLRTMRKQLFSVMLCLSAIGASVAIPTPAMASVMQSQIIKVRGMVVDENGEPIIGATITLAGKNAAGAITDLDGKFSIKVPAGGKIFSGSFFRITFYPELFTAKR